MIIGLNGTMGAGKTTAANLIEKLSARPIKIIKFAAPLYDMQEYIYRRIAQVYQRPATFIKDRTLLQWIGTDWGRGTISESIWVDLWKADAKEALSQGYNVICDDVRFDNEAETIRRLGGLVINIKSNRGDTPNSSVKGITGHASESGVNSALISRYVRNDGTEKEFEATLTKILIEERLKLKGDLS